MQRRNLQNIISLVMFKGPPHNSRGLREEVINRELWLSKVCQGGDFVYWSEQGRGIAKELP